MTNQVNNASRFDGFADLYDFARPAAPSMAAEIIMRHLNRTKPVCLTRSRTSLPVRSHSIGWNQPLLCVKSIG
jgi:hypothetical protein